MSSYFLKFTGKSVLISTLIIQVSFAYGLVQNPKNCPLENVAGPKKSMVEIVAQLKELKNDESCKDLDNTCELRGEGDVAGVWKKHRIFFNHSVIVGSNDMDGVLENFMELKASGVCQN